MGGVVRNHYFGRKEDEYRELFYEVYEGKEWELTARGQGRKIVKLKQSLE